MCSSLGHVVCQIYFQLTPMGAAYLKGHLGLARFMLDIPEVNVDFQDEQGTVYNNILNLLDNESY